MKFNRDEAHLLRVLGRIQSINTEELTFRGRVRQATYVKKIKKELDTLRANQRELGVAMLPLETM